MSARPAGLSAELIGECHVPGRPPTPHRVWILTNGRVLTPDHEVREEAEDVMAALGGEDSSFCDYWKGAIRFQTAHPIMSQSYASSIPVVDRKDGQVLHHTIGTWRFTYSGAWTNHSRMPTLSRILGIVQFDTMSSPEQALAVTQEFVAFGRLPGDLPSVVASLSIPRTMRGKWDASLVDPRVVGDLLRSGAPVELAAPLAILGFEAASYMRGAGLLRQWALPPSMLLNLSQLFDPEVAIALLEELPADSRGKKLPKALGTVQEEMKEGDPLKVSPSFVKTLVCELG